MDNSQCESVRCMANRLSEACGNGEAMAESAKEADYLDRGSISGKADEMSEQCDAAVLALHIENLDRST